MSALSAARFIVGPKLYGPTYVGRLAGFVVIAALGIACLVGVIEMAHTVGPVADGAVRIMSDPRSMARF